MVTSLAAEFGFKLAAAGLLTTGVFLTHGAMQIPGGYLADRLGRGCVADLGGGLASAAGRQAITLQAPVPSRRTKAGADIWVVRDQV
jgi:MFS family permease